MSDGNEFHVIQWVGQIAICVRNRELEEMKDNRKFNALREDVPVFLVRYQPPKND